MQKLKNSGKFSKINQSDVKFWLDWRNYGAVSYWLSCTLNVLKFKTPFNLWESEQSYFELIGDQAPFVDLTKNNLQVFLSLKSTKKYLLNTKRKLFELVKKIVKLPWSCRHRCPGWSKSWPPCREWSWWRAPLQTPIWKHR